VLDFQLSLSQDLERDVLSVKNAMLYKICRPDNIGLDDDIVDCKLDVQNGSTCCDVEIKSSTKHVYINCNT